MSINHIYGQSQFWVLPLSSLWTNSRIIILIILVNIVIRVNRIVYPTIAEALSLSPTLLFHHPGLDFTSVADSHVCDFICVEMFCFDWSTKLVTSNRRMRATDLWFKFWTFSKPNVAQDYFIIVLFVQRDFWGVLTAEFAVVTATYIQK